METNYHVRMKPDDYWITVRKHNDTLRRDALRSKTKCRERMKAMFRTRRAAMIAMHTHLTGVSVHSFARAWYDNTVPVRVASLIDNAFIEYMKTQR